MTNPLRKYLLPPDVYIRHWLVTRQLKKVDLDDKTSVLDVGGSLGELRKFVDNIKVTTADVTGGDVLLKPETELPFTDSQFDMVVSIDTLEHIPGDKRMEFLSELVRVAKRQILLIAPFASEPHIRHEQKLKHRFERLNKPLPPYLAEHLKFGLVQSGFLNEVKREYPEATIRLSGSVALDAMNFNVHMFEVKNGKINRLIYLAKFIWNMGQNLLLPTIVFQSSPKSASRVLIKIIKS